MPIKACSRCGLKVLVDASLAASDNYLCPRCAPDAKPASAPPPRPAGGKRPSVKVTCPYCGASFSGSMPSRPAKGGCPVCQKELVLLPDGTIQAAATFNLQTWQKEKKSASNPPAAAPAMPEAPPELPTAHDPLGGSTILDMGGPGGGPPPAPMPSLDEPTMALPGGLGGETMLGMGGMHDAQPPAPTIEEPAAAPEPEPMPEPPRDEPPQFPDDLGGATILDMGPRPVELPPPDIEEKSPAPDLLSEMMPGIDRPPSAESPVAPPTPPPIPEEPATLPEPELEPDVTEGPTIRDADTAPIEGPSSTPSQEEAEAASIESAPEIPADLGGQTMLGIGGSEDMGSSQPEPAPSIEEPPPEAVPILAKDIAGVDPMPEPTPEPEPDPDVTAMAPGQATPKPYVYQPIQRGPRAKAPPIEPPSPTPAPPPRAPSPPQPPIAGAPVLGSDFRIASVPPPPKPVVEEPARVEKKSAGPKTSAVVLPRAQHSLMKLAMAWILMLLPAGAAFGLHSMQKNETFEKLINRFTAEALPGINKMKGEIEKAIKKAPEAPPESK